MLGYYPLSSAPLSSLGEAQLILLADAGAYALTGQDAGLFASRRMSSDVGVYALTGQNAGLLRGRRMPSDAGAYVLTGQDARLFQPGVRARGRDLSGPYVLVRDQSEGQP